MNPALGVHGAPGISRGKRGLSRPVRRSEQGSTLIEAMLAVVILSLVVAGAVRLLGADMLLWERAAARSRAAAVAETVLHGWDIGDREWKANGATSDGRVIWNMTHNPGPYAGTYQVEATVRWADDPEKLSRTDWAAPFADQLVVRRWTMREEGPPS
ncbi:MAG: prepilin-type N-terminal cleavage/methylation domain-containing protein [Candidatus Schekmanbacteria bacterium]|nr:prepilin-type N-terminal cleavage/methylation domain-containing protein [Candidatus Schekmanbacteria bacterium]